MVLKGECFKIVAKCNKTVPGVQSLVGRGREVTETSRNSKRHFIDVLFQV